MHYTPAAHRHRAFDGLPASARPLELPESEAWAQEELSLPMFAELTGAEVERVIAACRTACPEAGRAEGIGPRRVPAILADPLARS